MKAPEKREFWIHDGKNSIRHIKPHEQVECHNDFIHVISADWVEAEINRLKEENERLKIEIEKSADMLLEASKLLKVKKVYDERGSYIDKLKEENYRLRCEMQSYINSKETAEFCEKQAYDRLAESKKQVQELVNYVRFTVECGHTDDCLFINDKLDEYECECHLQGADDLLSKHKLKLDTTSTD